MSLYDIFGQPTLPAQETQSGPRPVEPAGYSLDGLACANCGTILARTGNCFTCPQCGDNTGCS